MMERREHGRLQHCLQALESELLPHLAVRLQQAIDDPAALLDSGMRPRKKHVEERRETVSHLVGVASWFLELDEIEDERDAAIEKLSFERQRHKQRAKLLAGENLSCLPSPQHRSLNRVDGPCWVNRSGIVQDRPSGIISSSTRPSKPSSASQRLTML